MMKNIVIKHTITTGDPTGYCDALAHYSGLSKSRIKKAMACGAAWIARPGKKMRRMRRAKSVVRPGDVVALYYDETILALSPPQAHCIQDLSHYSIWHKPAGLMSQGTRYGDHCALLRQVEQAFAFKRRALPVHRLDREASGLIMVAHHRRSAAALSEMLHKGKIDKQYQARVWGNLSSQQDDGVIDMALDGRPALTHYQIIAYDEKSHQSLVRIQIVTGRQHQIRRHFEMIGHPVMGDPRYGNNNKNSAGLQLTACGLAFTCPFGNGAIHSSIDPEKMS